MELHVSRPDAAARVCSSTRINVNVGSCVPVQSVCVSCPFCPQKKMMGCWKDSMSFSQKSKSLCRKKRNPRN